MEMQQRTITVDKYANTIWLGPFFTWLAVYHPDAIKPVLKVSDPKNEYYNYTVKDWLGNNFFTCFDTFPKIF